MKATPGIPHYQLYEEVRPLPKTYFNIEEIQALIAHTGTTHHPHRHPELYQLIWITQGSGEHFIDAHQYALQPNTIYLLSPGIVHACRSSQDLQGYILHFSSDYLMTYPVSNALRPSGYEVINVVQASEYREITMLLKKIAIEFAQDRYGKTEVIRSLLTLVLQYKERILRGQGGQAEPSSYIKLSQDFMRLVEIHYVEKKKGKEYAKLLHISQVHLSYCVKKATGLGVGKHIQNRILLEAKRLLIFSALNISEVAYELGFNDRDYFWRYFKRGTGMSPGDFRKDYQLISLS